MMRLTTWASTTLAVVLVSTSTSAALGLASRIEVEIGKQVLFNNLLTIDSTGDTIGE